MFDGSKPKNPREKNGIQLQLASLLDSGVTTRRSGVFDVTACNDWTKQGAAPVPASFHSTVEPTSHEAPTQLLSANCS